MNSNAFRHRYSYVVGDKWQATPANVKHNTDNYTWCIALMKREPTNIQGFMSKMYSTPSKIVGNLALLLGFFLLVERMQRVRQRRSLIRPILQCSWCRQHVPFYALWLLCTYFVFFFSSALFFDALCRFLWLLFSVILSLCISLSLIQMATALDNLSFLMCDIMESPRQISHSIRFFVESFLARSVLRYRGT